MIANALFAAMVCLVGALLYVLEMCTFLEPYRDLIWSKYLSTILTFAGLVLVNLFALFYLLIRAAFLKDTGQKLAHLEKELRTGGAISEEFGETA